MADVFISYSDKSPETAEAIADELDRAGISYWLARRHMKIGQSFPKEIQKAIKNCKVFLLILDKNSNQSEHVLNEINLAFRRKNNHESIDFLVFKTDDCKVSVDIDYFLNRFQYMDGNPPDAQGIQSLIAQIAELLGIEIQMPSKNTESPDSLLKFFQEMRVKLFKGIFIFISGLCFMSMTFQFHQWQIDDNWFRLIITGVEFCSFLIMLLTGIFSRGFYRKESIVCALVYLMYALCFTYLWTLQECEFWFVIFMFIMVIASIMLGITYKRIEKWCDKWGYKWLVKWADDV